MPSSWNASGLEGLAFSLTVLLAAVFAGSLVYFILFRWLLRFAERPETRLDTVLVRYWRGPARLLLPLFLILVAAPSLRFSDTLQPILRHMFNLAFIAVLAWLFANTVFALRDLILSRYDVSLSDNLKARAVHTQINVLVKILLVIIAVVAASTMLMSFEKIRQVGVSLLASAGLFGIIAGFAAQKSLATLFAGIQIALTQPVRIDDVVIVEGEWGRIEEITLTYVVVRIWDLRRLIVPITYFLDKPFQNWTRTSADILGTVFLYVDYTLPVETLRRQLRSILEESALWDGKVCNLVVTEARESTVEVRALMSARDSSSAWDLRCEVREKLLLFLQENYPESLPRFRAEIGTPGVCTGSKACADACHGSEKDDQSL